MPELPEVETVVRGLRPVLRGATVDRLELKAPRVYRHTWKDKLEDTLKNATVENVSRRGKFILLELNGGRPPLAIHLRMSGKLIFGKAAQQHADHIRATFHLRDKPPLHFVDTRQFGTFFLIDGEEPEGYRKLGLEPLSRQFTRKRLAEMLGERRTPIKSFLLQQETVAGVGNIYACEALWEAKLHPRLQTGELNKQQIGRLHRAVRDVLRNAIDQMGTTFSDFKRPDGQPGEFANKLHVYKREGQPCHRCGTDIERIQQSGRSTFFCPRCQHTSRRT